MKMKTAILALALGVVGTTAQAGIFSSIKGIFTDCSTHCEKEHIDCNGTDATKKGTLPYCQAKCLGSDQGDKAKIYQEGVDSCKAAAPAQ